MGEARSGLMTASTPVAFVKLSKKTNQFMTVDAVLGKVIEGNGAAATNQGRYAICPEKGEALAGCGFSVTQFSAPGSPRQIDFYDPLDVNKSVVVKARIECSRAKSVFKS